MVSDILRGVVVRSAVLRKVVAKGYAISEYMNRGPHARATAAFRNYCNAVPGVAGGAVFIKIGANDGVTDDPCSDLLLADRRWRGVLIEPVPYCFRMLQQNFTEERFQLIQAAIGPQAGRRPFYFVAGRAAVEVPNLPPWYDKLGSFDRQHIINHLGEELRPYISAEEVDVLRLSDIFESQGIQVCDLLHIDAEGYDFEILKTLDFEKNRVAAVYVEHKHLTRAARRAMRRLLARNGFSVLDCGADYFAVSRTLAPLAYGGTATG